MKAAIFREHGPPERLEYTDMPEPVAGPGEVLVRVHAAALNHLDLFVRAGIPGLKLPLPHIGGSDIAGEIESLGARVDGWQVGERVVVNPGLSCGRCEWCLGGEESLCQRFRILGEHLAGGMAELVVVPASNLYPIPDDEPFERAAAAPLVFATAWRALIGQARLRAGESVLILGAGGGVATAAIQIARLAGARVYVASRSATKLERARELGADDLLDSGDDYAREIWVRTGKRGVDVVLENIGGATWERSLRSLARGGRLVTYGATTGHQVSIDLRQLFWKQYQIMGSTMANRREFETVMRLVFWDRRLRPVVDRMLPLSQAAEAHRLLESGEQFGKVVLTVGDRE